MFNSKISLDQFTHTLIETINNANVRIHTEYIATTREQKDTFPTPPPLTVKNAKINFNATLSKQSARLGDALMLDFSKPNGNFHGELVLDTPTLIDEEEPQDEEELPPTYNEEEEEDEDPVTPEIASMSAMQGQAAPPRATLFAQQLDTN